MLKRHLEICCFKMPSKEGLGLKEMVEVVQGAIYLFSPPTFTFQSCYHSWSKNEILKIR